MATSSPNNMCRRALNNGKLVCKGKDLLTECEVWSKKLCIHDVTKGCLDKKKKNYLKTLVKKQIKFRYSADKNSDDSTRHKIMVQNEKKMTLRIKANRSSAFKDTMGADIVPRGLTKQKSTSKNVRIHPRTKGSKYGHRCR